MPSTRTLWMLALVAVAAIVVAAIYLNRRAQPERPKGALDRLVDSVAGFIDDGVTVKGDDWSISFG